MNIVILDAYAANPGDLSWNELEKLGDVVVYDRTPAHLTLERAQNAEAIFTNKVVLDAKIIAELPKLRFIGILATGTNVVDLEFARERGVVVTNIPKYSSESVVQSTFAHLLNLAIRLSDNVAANRAGAWTRSPDFSFSSGKIVELSGKQLGVVGFGAIGRRVAEVAMAFGMKVVAYGPHLPIGETINGVPAVPLDELFRTSDVVTLHCPLTESTRALVDASRLETMKSGAFLINTGRGPLLDETAVANALQSGRLGGLGADVLSTEPPEASNPLLTAPNCYLTAHNAWASFEARRRLIEIAVENLRAFQRGERLNVVND